MFCGGILAHGSQQLLAWFGGRGFKGTLSDWKQKCRIPIPIGAIGIFTEFFGSIALFVGVLTRPFALGLTILHAGRNPEVPLGIRLLLGAPPGRGQRN